MATTHSDLGDVGLRWLLVPNVNHLIQALEPWRFHQRFIGRFTRDGNTIKGAWEKSKDGSRWEHDFDLTYTKMGPRRRRA